jgi:hypothetical protein
MEYLFYSKIYHTNHHSVEAKDEHGADGDESDDAAFNSVDCFR